MDLYWIWLSQIKYVGPVLQKRLLANFNDSPKDIYLASQDDLEKIPRSVIAPLTPSWRTVI